MAFPDSYESCTYIDPAVSVDVVDYDRIQAMIAEGCNPTSPGSVLDKLATMQDYLCACSEDSKELLSSQLTQVHSELRQIMIGLEDEINENEVIITNSNKTMKLII